MRDTLASLNDIRHYAREAQAGAGGLSAERLSEAHQQRHAALYCLVVVGTAMAALPDEVKSLAPEIPWRAVSGLRNHVVHAHWQVDFTIIADVIATRLDPLIEALDRLIADLERKQS